MFCAECGSKIKDGALFCTNCGARVARMSGSTVFPGAVLQPADGVPEPIPAEEEPEALEEFEFDEPLPDLGEELQEEMIPENEMIPEEKVPEEIIPEVEALTEEVIPEMEMLTEESISEMETPEYKVPEIAVSEIEAPEFAALEAMAVNSVSEDDETPLFCGNCGVKLKPGYRFCVRCGAPVEYEAYLKFLKNF